MARIPAIEDDADVRLCIKTRSIKTLIKTFSDAAPGVPIVAVDARREYDNGMTASVVRATFAAGTTAALREPFKNWEFTETIVVVASLRRQKLLPEFPSSSAWKCSSSP